MKTSKWVFPNKRRQPFYQLDDTLRKSHFTLFFDNNIVNCCCKDKIFNVENDGLFGYTEKKPPLRMNVNNPCPPPLQEG